MVSGTDTATNIRIHVLYFRGALRKLRENEDVRQKARESVT